MRKNLLSKLLLFVLLFATTISNAQSPTAPALAFNVFAQNGCSFYSSETEGPVAMGGDLTIAGSYGVAAHNNFSYQVSGVNIGLLVGGKVNYNGGSSLQVLNNGYVKIGTQNGSKAWYLDNNNAASPIRITASDDYNGSPNILLSAHASDLGNVSANNNPVFQSGLIDFAAAFTTMKASATSMSGIAANAGLTNPNGDVHSSFISTVLNHTPGGQIKININSGNNILNVTGDELNSVTNFTFNNSPDASHVLIINVNASGTFNWSAWTNGGLAGQSNCAYIIYNFYNTTTLNIGGNGAVEGTVFAPYADISKSSNNSNIEGQVICKSYSQSAGGEIHFANFIPNAPGCTLPTVADITGSSSLNVGATITLADATAGGTWSSSNTGVATVSSGGVVTGVSGGTATITYSVTNSCGTSSKTKSITVVRNEIDNKNCPSTFKRNNGDGSPQVVTVFASNVIGTTYYANRIQPESNNNQGKVTFTYASSINYPPVITKSWVDGSVNWTWGNNGTGSPFNPPGVPSSNDVAYTFYNYNLPPANVLKFELTDPQTGQVINTCSYGSDGNVIVPPTNLNYSASGTVCQGTAGNSVTPTITASGTVTYSLSGNPTGVTINSTTGVISWTNAVAAAVYTMTVTASNTFAPNATFTYTLTVNPLPVIGGDITGTATVCKNATTTLSNVTAGGTWSTSDVTIATVSAGVVTGVAAGTATITYSITNSCGTTSRTKVVTVNDVPAIGGDITGTATVCKNATTALANVTAGGTWSTSNAAIATVSSGGVVTGVAAGTATITYSITNTCGTTSRTKLVTVNDVPAIGGDITGTATVCKNATTTLANVTAGGTWSTSDATIATVSSGGVVTGVAAGTATITYSITNTCGTTSRTKLVTVNDVPAIGGDITGTATVCKNATTTLANVTSGGTWSTSNAAVATVNPNGVVTGVAAGTATITYSITNTCGTTSRTKLVTVNDVPAIGGDITGTATVCKNATTTLANVTAGGTWSTSDATIATVSSGGVVTGVAAGTATITYSITNSCGTTSRTKVVTVNDVPSIGGDITGAATVCKNATTTLANVTAGGTWSTSNAAVATVSSGGVVTGVAAGTATITYSITNSCGTTSRTKVVTVNDVPVVAEITGIATVCKNSTTTLADATAGGAWITSNNLVTVSGGIVTGVAVGTTTISYSVTNSCGTTSQTKLVTINDVPTIGGDITGTATVCKNATTTLSNVTAGGTWSTSDATIATVSSGGVVTGVAAGTATITYSITNSCGTTSRTKVVTVNDIPVNNSVINNGPYICVGSTLALIANSPNGTWSSLNTNIATVNSNGVVTGVSAGSTNIYYTITNACGSNVSAPYIEVLATPSAPTVSITQPTCNIATGSITVTAPTAVGMTYSIDGTNYQSSATFSSLAKGTYSITAKSAGGCISSSATTAVITNAAKPNDFAYTNNYLTTTQPLSTNSFGFVVYGNAAGDTYNWDFGDGTTSTAATPTKSYSAFGIYNVRLIATNTGGCSDTTYQTVVVTPASKPMDAVPVCNAATATTITQTLIFPRSTTDWASSNLKQQKAAKFDTTLGTLLAVKVINNGSFTTNNKVEITGNMAAGTKRLVNIQVDGTMDFYAPGFLYGITPPTIIDSFSSTGFDGVKDFAGTSGKNFGPHTSAKTDSTVFTSAASLANYKGSDSIALTVYTNTNFSASFPTGNDTASISTTATDTATIVYYYCPSSGGVSGGDGGGLESKSLGDAIVKRVYNKAFNSLQKPVDYIIMSPIGERTARATTMGVGTGGKLTLADILPQHLSKYGLVSYVSTPTDIPSITNASDVLSIDYTLNNQAKAVSFGTQTSNAVYDHTKAICDRLKGSVLIDIKNVLINNVQMVAYTLKTATGNTEYAMSFAIGAKSGRNSYTLQSNWLNQDYVADETMYNIQLWAVSPTIVTDMATDIINNLQSTMPVQTISAKKLPDTYITSGNRDRTDLVLSVTNNQTNSNGYFVIEDKSNELSTGTTKRTVPFTVAANGKANITVPMSDIYESTISMYINNQLQDVVYMADGTWSYGAGASSNVTSFKVSNDTNKTYASDELPVFRNVQVSGTSSDYVSIFKLMKGGAVAQDLSAYKTLKFSAEGGYNLRVTLVKSSIVNWADQYSTLIPLDKASKEYFVSLDAFTSAASKDRINANDVTTIVFSIETGNGQNSVLNTTLNSISFTKQTASYLQSLSAKEVMLYPNPAPGSRFTCSFMSDKASQLTLRVVELTTGKVIHSQQVNAITGQNNVQVDVSRSNSGSAVYIIALDGENVQYKKAKIIAGNR